VFIYFIFELFCGTDLRGLMREIKT